MARAGICSGTREEITSRSKLELCLCWTRLSFSWAILLFPIVHQAMQPCKREIAVRAVRPSLTAATRQEIARGEAASCKQFHRHSRILCCGCTGKNGSV